MHFATGRSVQRPRAVGATRTRRLDGGAGENESRGHMKFDAVLAFASIPFALAGGVLAIPLGTL